MANRFILNETSYHGSGAVKEVVTEVKARGFKKTLIVTCADLVKFGVVGKVTTLLDGIGHPYAVYDKVEPNPTVECVKEGVAMFKTEGRTASSPLAAAPRRTPPRASASL